MTTQLFKKLESVDEIDWLVKRQSLVTATDMSRLMTGGPIIMERIAEEKRNPPQPLKPTRTLDWGHEREPFIVSRMNEMTGYSMKHNTELCVRIDEEKFGGTPDAISFVEPVVGECKTYSGERFAITDEHFYQCGWNIYVTNSELCCYGWEEHDDFVPRGDVQMQIINKDQSLIDAMIMKAYDFLDYLNTSSQTASEELDRLILEHDKFNDMEKKAKAEKERVKNLIRSLKGAYNEYGYVSDVGSISSSYPKPRAKINEAKLRKDLPDVYDKYVTITEQMKPTLTISRKKVKEVTDL